jgi:hypothetical protein
MFGQLPVKYFTCLGSEAEANAITSDFGTAIGPIARQAIENRLGS